MNEILYSVLLFFAGIGFGSLSGHIFLWIRRK